MLGSSPASLCAPWLELLGRVLSPERPDLERCLRQREQHLVQHQRLEVERLAAVARCERDIERARAVVFAANDGVVPALMTELERQWRRLSRPDLDAGLPALWAQLTPPSWRDLRPWQDADPASRLELLIALASDVPAMEAARSAMGPALRWRLLADDCDATVELLAGPLAAAREALAARGTWAVMEERAGRLGGEVEEAARRRFPARPLLARGIGHAAFVEYLLRAAELGDRSDPVTPLRQLWSSGQVLCAVDSAGVTVGVPPL